MIFSGILLPVSAMAVIGKCGSVTSITGHVSKNYYNLVIGAIMLIVLFVANPRTAATAIEMGLQGNFPKVPYIPCVVVYFFIGPPVDTGIEAPFVNAFLGGYQTGDVLVSFLLASVFLGTIIRALTKTAAERYCWLRQSLRSSVSPSCTAGYCIWVLVEVGCSPRILDGQSFWLKSSIESEAARQ